MRNVVPGGRACDGLCMSKTPKPSPTKKPAPANEAAKPEKLPKTNKAAVADGPAEPVAKPVAAKAAASSAEEAAFVRRLQEMTDFALRAQQMSATRISRDTAHVKSASAKAQLLLIETEISRRTTSPEVTPSPTRAPMASPKQGKKGKD